jgi:hypothetical protein
MNAGEIVLRLRFLRIYIFLVGDKPFWMIMKIKSSVLFGLIVVIFSVSGFSLLKRLTQDIDEWRPSDLYSTTNVFRRSTYSVVSSGASASYSGAVPSVTSGASSMFHRRAVSSYAPAMSAHSSLANSQYPIGGTPSNSVASPVYTTSSAEFRSFGGGGNAGGVSMSGGSVKSSGSSVAPASGLNVSMPSTSMYAYNSNRSSASDVMSSMSGDIAMTSSHAYAGIGNTTGGASRGISGRRDVPSIGGESDEGVFNKVLINICGSLNFGLSYRELKDLFDAVYGFGTAPISWPQFWAWYQQMSGTQDSPVGDILPLLLLSFVAIIAKLLKSINLKLQNHSSENSK